MAKLKQVADRIHSTEREFDSPKPGDVRIEEGIARDSETGEVLVSLVQHRKSGRVVRANEAGFDQPHTFETVRPEQRAHKVYRYVERPLSGQYGLYAHEDNTPGHEGHPKDDEGFSREQ
jgi:hypothetical protein